MKLMSKFPGGTLLIPMFLSSLIHSFFPNLFKIGGLTEGLLSGSALGFILGSAVMISACSLDFTTIGKVAKRYSLLIGIRLVINILLSLAFVSFFGLEGFWGLSAIAFITTLTSTNPTLFLGIVRDFGDPVDQSAFGLVSLLASPLVPMIIYGFINPTNINILPFVSTLIPLILGIIIGNTDRELAKLMSSAMPYIIILLGWAVGAGINMLDALKAGIPGIIMLVFYYLFNASSMFLTEKYILRRKGVSSIGLSTIAGVSSSVPLLMSASNPEIAVYAPEAAAIVTLGVVGTAIFSPLLAKKISK